MATHQDNAANTDKETGRVETFSDGVFAIAITLLVLDIKVPPANGGGAPSLLSALSDQWPSYVAYVTSFLTILIMWINHHKMLLHIKRIDHLFLLLNGLLLMGVTLVPFPTGLLSAYIGERDAWVAAAVFSGCFVVIALFFNLLWRYAAHGARLLGLEHDRIAVERITRQYRFGPVLYIIAFVLAFISVPASVGACMLLAVFFALPGR